MGASIILDIARVPSQGDLRDALLGPRVNHGIMLPCFVSDKDFVISLIVDQTIRAVSNRNPGEDGVGMCINHNHLILRIGSSEDQPKIRGDGDGMHIANP